MWCVWPWQLVLVMQQRMLCGSWTAKKVCWQVTTADHKPSWLCCGDWSSSLLQHALQVSLQAGLQGDIMRLLHLHDDNLSWYQA
jgi:hypothetical protein